jgi:hypothetical protein
LNNAHFTHVQNAMPGTVGGFRIGGGIAAV